MTEPLDLSALGQVAAELMERLEAEHEGGELGVVAVVAEINHVEGEEEWTAVEYRCSDARRWIQAGLFAAAQRATEASSDRRGEDE